MPPGNGNERQSGEYLMGHLAGQVGAINEGFGRIREDLQRLFVGFQDTQSSVAVLTEAFDSQSRQLQQFVLDVRNTADRVAALERKMPESGTGYRARKPPAKEEASPSFWKVTGDGVIQGVKKVIEYAVVALVFGGAAIAYGNL